jgi:two-component system nitrogen regulation response regulator GlnG
MNEIYIVDDDRSVRFVLAAALRDAGHAVAEFASAEDVQRALRRDIPAVLLCDVRLPGTDGLMLLREA